MIVVTAVTKPAHVQQWTGPGPLELVKPESGRPGLTAYPSDYVLSYGGGHREVMDQPTYEAQFGKPDRSEYWDAKIADELQLAAQHEVAHGGPRRHG